MNRMIAAFLSLFVISISAQATKATPENTDLYFIYCANGDGYFKKLDWKQMGNEKPVFLKKGTETFRVEVFFDRDETTYDSLKKVKGSDVIRFFLRKDEMRSNGALHQSDNDISDNEKMSSFGGDFYHVLYLARKGIAPAEVIKTAIQSCNETARKVQGSGNLDEIRNKKTNQLLELEIGSADS
jgi:hypothetical protein